MNVYSILAHPNLQSLNSRMFAQANKHFLTLGYNVDTIHLYENFSAILDSQSMVYKNKIALEERGWQSSMNANYTKGIEISDDFTKNEIAKIKNADLLYIQTPILVWALPAILKFYIELIFLPQQMFILEDPWSDHFNLIKLMEGKKVFCSLTFGSGAAVVDHVTGGIENITNPIKSRFGFGGFEWVDPHVVYGITETKQKNDEYFVVFNNKLINTFAAPT